MTLLTHSHGLVGTTACDTVCLLETRPSPPPLCFITRRCNSHSVRVKVYVTHTSMIPVPHLDRHNPLKRARLPELRLTIATREPITPTADVNVNVACGK